MFYESDKKIISYLYLDKTIYLSTIVYLYTYNIEFKLYDNGCIVSPTHHSSKSITYTSNAYIIHTNKYTTVATRRLLLIYSSAKTMYGIIAVIVSSREFSRISRQLIDYF